MRKRHDHINKSAKTTSPQPVRAANVKIISEKDFQMVSIEKLKPSPHNARTHSKKQIEQIRDSILKFGMITPLVVDNAFNLIAGHGRLEAMKEAGLSLVPIIRVDHLSEKEKRAYALSDNRLAELSRWDEKTLATELAFLVEAELSCEIDFATEITGFSTPEIDVLLLKQEEQDDSDAVMSGVLPELGKPAVSVSGDIWNLGAHRVACGDSQDPALYKQLLRGTSIDLICSGPPI